MIVSEHRRGGHNAAGRGGEAAACSCPSAWPFGMAVRHGRSAWPFGMADSAAGSAIGLTHPSKSGVPDVVAVSCV